MAQSLDRRDSDIPDRPPSRIAEAVFDERPVAVRGGLQVMMALMIGVLIGNSLNMMI